MTVLVELCAGSSAISPRWNGFLGRALYRVEEGDAATIAGLVAAGGGRFHCLVTSPPYWGLRAYAGVAPVAWPEISYSPMAGLPAVTVPAWTGDLGLEPTPEMYVGHLVHVFRAERKALREDGTLWLNLGDCYAAARSYQVPDSKHVDVGNSRGSEVPSGLKPKDLLGIPWRVAFALQADGWWLRGGYVWAKTAPMPESVTDRCTTAHEFVFHFARSESYFYDAEAVKEASVADHPSGNGYKRGARLTYADASGARGNDQQWQVQPTRNLRSVWTIQPGGGDWNFCLACSRFYGAGESPRLVGADGQMLRRKPARRRAAETPAEQDALLAVEALPNPDAAEWKEPPFFCASCQTLRPEGDESEACACGGEWVKSRKVCRCGRDDAWVDHYALMPSALAERCIKAGTSERGCCAECGAPWRRVTERTKGEATAPPKLRAAAKTGMVRNGTDGSTLGIGGGGYGAAWAEKGTRTLTVGWEPTCSCNAGDPIPCIVHDPFTGGGTTLLVARRLGRRAHGSELSPAYAALAHHRIEADAPLLNRAANRRTT